MPLTEEMSSQVFCVVRFSWNFQSDVKCKLVPALNFPPTLGLVFRRKASALVCLCFVHPFFFSYQRSLFIVCMFVFLTLVAEFFKAGLVLYWGEFRPSRPFVLLICRKYILNEFHMYFEG